MKLSHHELDHGGNTTWQSIEIPFGRVLAYQIVLTSNRFLYGAATNVYQLSFQGPQEQWRLNTNSSYTNESSIQHIDFQSEGRFWFRGSVAAAYTISITFFYEDEYESHPSQELSLQRSRR